MFIQKVPTYNAVYAHYNNVYLLKNYPFGLFITMYVYILVIVNVHDYCSFVFEYFFNF